MTFPGVETKQPPGSFSSISLDFVPAAHNLCPHEIYTFVDILENILDDCARSSANVATEIAIVLGREAKYCTVQSTDLVADDSTNLPLTL